MLKIELLYVVLELQNQIAEPLNMEVACGKIKKTNWALKNQ